MKEYEKPTMEVITLLGDVITKSCSEIDTGLLCSEDCPSDDD